MENELRDALQRMGRKREIKGRKFVDAAGNVYTKPYALGAPYAPLTDLDLELAAFDEVVGLWQVAEEMCVNAANFLERLHKAVDEETSR